MKLNFNDIVKFELTEMGETVFKEFQERNEKYEIKKEGCMFALPFVGFMVFMASNGFCYSLIEDNCIHSDKGTFFLNCMASATLTEEGEAVFGTKILNNSVADLMKDLDLFANEDEWESLIDGEIEIDENSHHMVETYTIERNGQKVFCLECENIRVTVSNPRIQPFHTYKFDSMRDAMYFYYDMSIEENKNWRYGTPRWKNVCNQYVYENGMIRHLTEFIDSICKLDMEKEGKQVQGYSQKTMRFNDILIGFCDEDGYELTRYKNFENGKECYEFSCFFGNSQISSNLMGVRMKWLNQHDLKYIKKWTADFLSYAEEVTRRHVREEIEFDKNNKKVENGKLYVYEKRFDENRIIKNNTLLDSIIIPGDECSIQTLNIDDDKNIVIAKIKEDSIVTTNGEEYNLHDLLYLHRELHSDSKELFYNKEECKREIAKRLEDILDKDVEELVSAAVDSCWLCRNEHGFQDGYETAREILKELKS